MRKILPLNYLCPSKKFSLFPILCSYIYHSISDITNFNVNYRDELKKKYDGKLQKEMTGPLYEVISKVMKILVGRKITTPGSFKGYINLPFRFRLILILNAFI